MANLIDSTYFIVDLNLPVDEITTRLTSYITKYQPIILQKALGYDLYKAFSDGLLDSPILSKWTDLRDGKDYVVDGITYHWSGLVNTEKKSIIANYVLFEFFRTGILAVNATGIRLNKSENAVNGDPMYLQSIIWSEMLDMVEEMTAFINAKNDEVTDTYPNYLQDATFFDRGGVNCINI